ncbi:aldehyde-activating protein, partial [Sulfitobacter sp. HI0082]
MCRRWTGSAFLEIDAKPGSLTYDGPVKSYASSDWAERAWCDSCGSTLWYHLTLPGHDYYSLSAGLVENAGGLPLKTEIY